MRTVLVALCAAVLLVTVRGAGRADPLGIIPEPPSISPGEAAAHVGEVVDLEAAVAEVKSAPGRVVLRIADDGGPPLRIVIVRALVGPSATELVRRYAGQRVRARGRLDEFDGELEIVLSDPGMVVVVGEQPPAERVAVAIPAEVAQPAPVPTLVVERASRVAAVEPPAPTLAPEPVAPSPRATEPAPRPTEAPVRAAEPPAPAAAPAAVASGDADCRAAEGAWRSAAEAARGPLARLGGCLEAAQPPCATSAAEVRRTLAELAAAEERWRWMCAASER